MLSLETENLKEQNSIFKFRKEQLGWGGFGHNTSEIIQNNCKEIWNDEINVVIYII